MKGVGSLTLLKTERKIELRVQVNKMIISPHIFIVSHFTKTHLIRDDSNAFIISHVVCMRVVQIEDFTEEYWEMKMTHTTQQQLKETLVDFGEGLRLFIMYFSNPC